MKIVIFGYAIKGIKLYRELIINPDYDVIGFADNDACKQGNIVAGRPIMSMDDLVELKKTVEFSVIIASIKWFVIGEKLEKIGHYNRRHLSRWKD